VLTAALLLSACLPASDEACRPGFTRAGDGHCYPPPPDPAPPSITDAIEGVTCESLVPDGLVDLDGGCVDGACVGEPFADADEALGGGAGCAVASWSDEWVYCSWPVAVEALAPDLDRDGVPDADGRVEWLHLQPDCAYSTVDGLGVGIAPRCWFDVLGVPSSANFVDDGGVLALRDLYWTGYGVEVHDWTGPDGVVDDVYLFGAP
jgi:hypothetical protein